MTRIILRPMTLADLGQVEAIDEVSFPTPWPKDAFLYELKHKRNAVCKVAESLQPDGTGIVVGSIVIWLVLDEAHIATLAVRPGYRHQKIGQRLLAKSLLEAYQTGACQALLEVRETNLAAQALYQKFGFEVVGVRRGYYKDTHEDALLMTLEPIDGEKLAQLGEGG